MRGSLKRNSFVDYVYRTASLHVQKIQAKNVKELPTQYYWTFFACIFEPTKAEAI